MTSIRAEIDMIADSGGSVLITGPSGSGKDVVARLLHDRGSRATAPFVALNCAAVAADLLESEMFGHEAGAFTGAVKARAGRFEAAHGGTLFLDEVGDMSAAMQAKLLRTLETRIVERVGGMLPIAVDVRLIAATSVDLCAAIDRGQFRSDLLYRLDVIRIEMPALAERAGDIPELIAHFCNNGPQLQFHTAAMDVLMARPWPGNVRELRNFVDRALAHFPGRVIDLEALARLLRPLPGNAVAPAPVEPAIAPQLAPHLAMAAQLRSGGHVDLKRLLGDLEQACILEALTASGGTIAATARMLGLQRTTLVEKMRRHHIAGGTG